MLPVICNNRIEITVMRIIIITEETAQWKLETVTCQIDSQREELKRMMAMGRNDFLSCSVVHCGGITL